MVHIVYVGIPNLYWVDPGTQGSGGSGTSVTLTGGFARDSQPQSVCSSSIGTNSTCDIVVPSTNSTYSAWQAYNSATIAQAWRDASLNTMGSGGNGAASMKVNGTSTNVANAYYGIAGYVRYVNSGMPLSNGSNALEGGNAFTCITPTAEFDFVGSGLDIKNVSSGTSVNMYASAALPSWRASATIQYEWEESNNATAWTSTSQTGSTLNVTPTSPGSIYYRVKMRINDASGTGPWFYSTAIELVCAANYYFQGTTYATISSPNVTGSVVVTNAPVTLDFSVFGGASSGSYTSASFVISQLSIYDSAYASSGNSVHHTITISNNGTYTYQININAYSGGSGNNAAIQ